MEVARAAGVPKRHVYNLVHERMTRLLRYRHDGLTFDVRDEGPLDGDPVVLLHGFPERASCWRDVAPLLHAHGLRTYAPDQRGYSPGARPPPAPRLHDAASSSRRRRRADRDHRHARCTSSATTGAPTPAGWSRRTGPTWCARWTAVSVPHPAAFRTAMFGDAGRRSRPGTWAPSRLPRLPERLAARTGGRFDQGCATAA